MSLLIMVLKHLNMTFVQVRKPKYFEIGTDLTNYISRAMIEKDIFIALGLFGKRIKFDSFLDSSNAYYTLPHRWYVPCSDKYSRWSRIFRIFSLELRLVLFVSIVIAAISITLVGRYSSTTEWQRYKTLASSLTNLWAVILGVSVSTMPRAPSLRSLFLGWVCFSVVFSTVFQAFLTTFLIDSGYKTPIQNMDELFASGIKLTYITTPNFIFENDDETEIWKLQKNEVICKNYSECSRWAFYHMNVSYFTSDLTAEIYNYFAYTWGKTFEPFLCKLGNGVVYNEGLRMVMLNGDPLLRRVSEIIDRVVEAVFYNTCIHGYITRIKLETVCNVPFNRLMDITASTWITWNLPSISY